MSMMWDRKSYTSWRYTFRNSLTLREKTAWKWYPCPGFNNHKHHNREILFEHFHKRPQKSWMLYWRAHPAEYKQMLSEIRRKDGTLVKSD